MAVKKLENVVIEEAPEGALGFDVNHTLTAAQAAAAFKSGFQYCIRYVPRLELSIEPIGPPDISFKEANLILDSGLALILVQHVSAGRFEATGVKGMRFGKNAGVYATACGFPAGTSVFLDLESVSAASTPQMIKAFCNEWFDALDDFGFTPGVYVGSNDGLNAQQLFQETRFKHYWHAASEADPPKPRDGDRGYQLFQPLALTEDLRGKLKNVKFFKGNAEQRLRCFEVELRCGTVTIGDVDVDVARADKKGGRVHWVRRPQL